MTRLTFALAALACAARAAHCDPIVVRDATGQPVTIRDNSRIVSIGGAITEILYALGLEQRVVAIDSTSFYPPQALREKPNVGYMRALSPEGVLGLNPSLILATEDSGPKEAIAVLRAAGIPFVLVPDKYTGKGIIDKIEIVAAAAGSAERGTCLAKAVAADLDALAQIRSAGRAAAEGDVPALVRERPGDGRRPRHRRRRHHQARRRDQRHRSTTKATSRSTTRRSLRRKPDFVLAMRRDSHPLDAHTVFAHPGFALTPAAKRQAFVAMNGLYLLGFGPRTALAARDLAATLYPTLSAGKLPSEQDAARVQACRG